MFYLYADDQLLYNPLSENRMVFSPKLTLEMGKAGSLAFSLPPTNLLYDKLKKLKTIITVEQDGLELFRGRILSESRDFNNIKAIYCEGDLAYLVDSVQKNEAYQGTTHDFFRRILQKHNEQVEPYKRFLLGNITVEDRELLVSGQSEKIQDAETKEFDYQQIAINASVNEWKTSYDYLQEYLIEYCGGYLRTRKEEDGVYLDCISDFGGKAKQEIRFGENLLDLTEEISAEDVFTVLIPLGDDNLTIASVNAGSVELVDESAVEEFGRIVRTHVFDSVNDPRTLMENGLRYISNHKNVPVTITINAVDLHLADSDIQQLRLGDSVSVNSAPHSIVDSLTCTKIEYDLENPANNQYIFGTPEQTLTERYRKDIQKTTDTANANAARSGGGGGGAAAEEAKEEDAKAEEKFKAWCTVDDETGTVGIGTLYERWKNGTNILRNTCGIDLDAPAGNINIQNLKQKNDELGELILNQGARIDLINDEKQAKIDLLVSRTDHLHEVASAHEAQIQLLVTDNESLIELKADKTEVEGLELNVNTKITNINSEITKVKKMIADEINALKVDTAWLNGIQLHASLVYANSIDTDGLKVGYINCSTGMSLNGNSVATQKWVKDQDYLTAVPDYCRASTFSASTNMYIDGSAVATQAWVREQLKNYRPTWNAITDKPSTFKPSSHTHPFSFSKSLANGHTHKVTVNGKTYTSGGVSTNAIHSINVSGTTGSN